MEFTLEEQKARTNGNGTAPAANATTVAENKLLADLREELDGYYQRVLKFSESDPANVMRDISAISARLCFLRAQLQRRQSQRGTVFRTKEVDPLIEELDRQFKVHSRIISFAELEWKQAGGAQ